MAFKFNLKEYLCGANILNSNDLSRQQQLSQLPNNVNYQQSFTNANSNIINSSVYMNNQQYTSHNTDARVSEQDFRNQAGKTISENDSNLVRDTTNFFSPYHW